jgi:dsDNA-specific endonuclease/ATPase MutS2
MSSGHSNWLITKMRLSELNKQIMEAKENAYKDVYERVNSIGFMGMSWSGENTTVDLHGQTVQAAKKVISETILPVLPVLKKMTVITGRGLHSPNGQGVLKEALKEYLENELSVKYQDVESNDGAILIFT